MGEYYMIDLDKKIIMLTDQAKSLALEFYNLELRRDDIKIEMEQIGGAVKELQLLKAQTNEKPETDTTGVVNTVPDQP